MYDFKDAQKVTIILDNLNTHTKGSFYKRFEPEYCGTTATGEVWEQSGFVENVDTLEPLPLRRVELRLNEPTRDGETMLGLLSNLPADISAVQIADAYPQRRQIETAFQEIEVTIQPNF